MRLSRKAQLAAAVALASLASAPQAHALSFFVEAGPERFDAGTWGRLEPGFSHDDGPARFELRLPLRFGLLDGRLRPADWDSLSDAGRVLRQLQVELADRAFALELGVLDDQSLGHGTLVNGTGNGLDPDRMPIGAAARLAGGPLALDLLGSDVFAPELLAAAATLDPLSPLAAASDRIHLIFSAAGDRAIGWAERGPALFGGGADVVLWRGASLRLAPYTDWNARSGGGSGLHVGLLADWRERSVGLSAKAEWRRWREGYRPEFFDWAWIVERGDEEWRARSPAGEAGEARTASGWRGELRAEAAELRASLAASSPGGRGGIDATAQLAAEGARGQLAFFAGARTLGLHSDPERWVLAAEARRLLVSRIYGWTTLARLYHVSPTRPLWQAALGLGIAASP